MFRMHRTGALLLILDDAALLSKLRPNKKNGHKDINELWGMHQ